MALHDGSRETIRRRIGRKTFAIAEIQWSSEDSRISQRSQCRMKRHDRKKSPREASRKCLAREASWSRTEWSERASVGSDKWSVANITNKPAPHRETVVPKVCRARFRFTAYTREMWLCMDIISLPGVGARGYTRRKRPTKRPTIRSIALISDRIN